MKTCSIFLLAALTPLGTASTPHAEVAAKVSEDRPTLAIVVVNNLQDERGASTAFDRLDLAFHEVATKRKWPVAIAAERFAANTASHDVELRIFDQGLRSDLPGELKFRGWMTLTVRGAKHDFGIVSFVYNLRPAENMEDVLDQLYLGAANAAADKIEPILFPKPAKL